MNEYKCILATMWANNAQTGVRNAAFTESVALTMDVDKRWIDPSTLRFTATGDAEALKRFRRSVHRVFRSLVGHASINEVKVPTGDAEAVQSRFNSLQHRLFISQGTLLA